MMRRMEHLLYEERLRERWGYLVWGRLQEDLIGALQYLKGAEKKESDTFL